jgi:hypothetical protein
LKAEHNAKKSGGFLAFRLFARQQEAL